MTGFRLAYEVTETDVRRLVHYHDMLVRNELGPDDEEWDESCPFLVALMLVSVHKR